MTPAPADANSLIDTRRAGVCLHVTALPGPYGIGALGESAHWFVDRIADMGLSVWQVLPTGPTGYGNSPYQSLSVFAGNPMLIDPDTLAADGLVTAAELDSLPHGREDEVDFGRVIGPRAALLRRAAERFEARADRARRERFDAFVHRHGAIWLDDFALYRAVKHAEGERPWLEWPAPLRGREPAALAAFAKAHADELHALKVAQFLFFEQWERLRGHARARGVQLMGDAPIYVALDSADTWSHPELFELDAQGRPTAVGGVPPDYFSEDGQLWGNPLYRWSYHDATGYAWWIERLRQCEQLTDMIRIDHFRGFEAFWAIPAGAATARAGEWVPGPCDRFFDAVRAGLGPLHIVAEDLGVITDPVEALRKKYALPGMAVLQFELEEDDFDPAAIERDRICYTGTHDNDTSVGWFRGSGLRPADEIAETQARVLALCDEPAERVHIGMIRMAMHTKACMCIAPMQDFLGLGSSARFNTPGEPEGNWAWRLRREQFDDPLIETFAPMVQDSARQAPG